MKSNIYRNLLVLVLACTATSSFVSAETSLAEIGGFISSESFINVRPAAGRLLRASRLNRGNARKPSPPRKPQTPSFMGNWYAPLSLKSNTCGGSPVLTLNAAIGIDKNLDGIDLIDRSFLFRGRMTAANTIVFGRKRVVNGITQTQGIVIISNDGKSGSMGVESTLSAGSKSCKMIHVGSAVKR
jgi:hypothetical protein